MAPGGFGVPHVVGREQTVARVSSGQDGIVSSLNRLEDSRAPQSMERVLAEAVPEGVLAVRAGKIVVLNRAAARMLDVAVDQVMGDSLRAFWPELASAVDEHRPLERTRLKLGTAALEVTLRLVGDERCAVATFVAECGSAASIVPHAGGFLGVSAAAARLRELALIAARSFSGVLIEGESGVGKEVLAQSIHALGPRARAPFVAVLCAAIPQQLLESELFGYESGSFTGADPRGRPGKFELAHGGTLLLDDVVDMPLEMQAKLLRVLQERAVTRLGSARVRPVDVRIIATSNRAVADAVRKGVFRADLFYRLNVLNIVVPPLRDRRQDIAPLAEHFLHKHAAAHGSRLRSLGPEARRALDSYGWPGNARELEHCMEREIHFAAPEQTCLARLTCQLASSQRTPSAGRTLRDLEREIYAAALAEAGGDVSRAARELGVSRGKMYRKLRLHALLPQ